MLNISQLRLALAEDGVQATSIARAELTTRVSEFKELGPDARAIMFGSHRKAQAVIVPIDMFNQLLDMAEGVFTTPKSEPVKKRARLANSESDIENNVQKQGQEDNPGSETQAMQYAGSSLTTAATTQELLDEIMSKWKL